MHEITFYICMWICICQKSQYISTCICSQGNPLPLTESIANIHSETKYSICLLFWISHASSSHRNVQTFYLLFSYQNPPPKKSGGSINWPKKGKTKEAQWIKMRQKKEVMNRDIKKIEKSFIIRHYRKS